ncbi:DUF4998 domain-containing protein [Sphingobacterium kyonggiense]
MKNPIIILLFIVLASACSKPDEYYKDLIVDSDKNYPGKLQEVLGSPGYYRLKIKYRVPPNNSVNKLVIAGATDTQYFDIPAEKSGQLDSIFVSNLKETSYRYFVYTLNKDGNSSIKREMAFKVYGDRYKNGLSPLNIRSKATVNTKDLRLIFYGDRANVLAKSKFQYTNRENKIVKMEFSNPTDTIILPNYKTGSEISFSNGFLPSATAIDTVYLPFKTLIP